MPNHKLLKPVVLSLILAVTFGGLSYGEIVVNAPLVLLPEPPEGFRLWTQKIATKDGVKGALVAMGRDAPGCAVSITVETGFDRSHREARIAATKGYLNASLDNLTKAGFTFKTNSLPDLKKTAFDRPQLYDFEFAGPDGGLIYVHHKILFTDKGYNMQVLAKDKRNFAALKIWLGQVQIPSQQKQE